MKCNTFSEWLVAKLLNAILGLSEIFWGVILEVAVFTM